MARKGTNPTGWQPPPRVDDLATRILNAETRPDVLAPASLFSPAVPAGSVTAPAVAVPTPSPTPSPTPYPGNFNAYLTDYVSQLRKLLGQVSNIGVQQPEYDKALAAYNSGLSPKDAIAKEAVSLPDEQKRALLESASRQGQDVSNLLASFYPTSPVISNAPVAPPPAPPPAPPGPIKYVNPGEIAYGSQPPSSAPFLSTAPPASLPISPELFPKASAPLAVKPTFPEVPIGSESPLFNPGIPKNLPEQVQVPIEEKPIVGLNPADEAAALKRESELEQRANAEAIKAYLAQEEANAPLAVQSYLDLFQPAVERTIRKGAGLFAGQGLGSGGFEGSGAVQELVRRASENATQMAGEKALDQLLNARSQASLFGLENSQIPSLFRQQALTRGLEGKDIASERLFDTDLARLAANAGVSAQRSQTRRSKYGGIGSLIGGGLGYLKKGPIGGLLGSILGNAAGGLFGG